MTYRERVWAPIVWWIVGLGITATLAVAVIAYVEPARGIPFVVLGFALVIVGLLAYTLRIEIRDGELLVGRYRLEREYLGPVAALDGEATATALGPAAERDVLFVTRPFVRTAVRVGIDDAADPHPAWIVTTRRPEELAAALRTLRES